MKIRVHLLIKLAFSLTVLLGAFYFIEYGFTFDMQAKLLRAALLSALTTLMIFVPRFKHYAIIFSFVCLALMALAYIFSLEDISNTVGDFGFSLLVITTFLYLPQIIKKGCVEKY